MAICEGSGIDLNSSDSPMKEDYRKDESEKEVSDHLVLISFPDPQEICHLNVKKLPKT